MMTRRLLCTLLVAVLLLQGLSIIPQNVQASEINKVIILVDPEIMDGITVNLNQYAYDIYQLGYMPVIVSQEWNSAEQLRAYLFVQYLFGLVGVVIIGDVPCAIYEEQESEDFIPDPRMEEFPIDLFYMDLNGVWEDTDGNGIYDSHTGEKEPEIWLGRITANTISGDTVELTNRYLEKVHRYRIGELEPNGRGLCYVDDDWVPWANIWRQDLSRVYSNTILVANPTVTNGDQYKNELERDYEWIHVAAHSSHDSHHFKVLKVWQMRAVTSSDIMSICPSSYYYNLFACSAADYTGQDYLAGCYIFSDSPGMAAIGSTKTGAMKQFQDFYQPLSEGMNLGDAFKLWFLEHGLADPHWFYGLTIIGDPILGPRVPKVQDGGSGSNLKPCMTLHSPENDAVVEGFVSIEGTAWDDVEVASVWVKIDDGEWREAIGTLSWFYFWDTTWETAGSHTITSRAFDGELYSEEVSVSVTVKNQNTGPDDEDYVFEEERFSYAFGLSITYLVLLGGGIAAVVAISIIVIVIVKRRERYERMVF
jgi:hypothetical protein